MFGINLDLPRNIFWDVHRNQAFASKDFAAVAKALIVAQNSGKGAVARLLLETVSNPWYGLQAVGTDVVCAGVGMLCSATDLKFHAMQAGRLLFRLMLPCVQGRQVNVTFVVLSRAPAWESKLSQDLQSLVVPDKDPNNPTVTIDHGELEGFPNYDTLKLHYTPLQVSRVRDLLECYQCYVCMLMGCML